MVGGLFLWLALRYGTGYKTVWEIRPSAETPSSVQFTEDVFIFSYIRVHSASELFGRCALQIYLLTYLPRPDICALNCSPMCVRQWVNHNNAWWKWAGTARELISGPQEIVRDLPGTHAGTPFCHHLYREYRSQCGTTQGQYWAGRTPPPNNPPSNMAAANFVVIANREGCALNGTAVAAVLIWLTNSVPRAFFPRVAIGCRLSLK